MELASTETPTSYTYADQPHAVTALSTGEGYTYDASGNMIARVEGGLTYTQTFDAENRLVSVTVNSQTTQFVYDGDGNLAKKIEPDGVCTIYPSTGLRAGVGGVYEVEKAACGGAVTHTRVYYPAAGAMGILEHLKANCSLTLVGRDGLMKGNSGRRRQSYPPAIPLLSKKLLRLYFYNLFLQPKVDQSFHVYPALVRQFFDI
jgi:YD repeat-containing protein